MHALFLFKVLFCGVLIRLPPLLPPSREPLLTVSEKYLLREVLRSHDPSIHKVPACPFTALYTVSHCTDTTSPFSLKTVQSCTVKHNCKPFLLLSSAILRNKSPVYPRIFFSNAFVTYWKSNYFTKPFSAIMFLFLISGLVRSVDLMHGVLSLKCTCLYFMQFFLLMSRQASLRKIKPLLCITKVGFYLNLLVLIVV